MDFITLLKKENILVNFIFNNNIFYFLKFEIFDIM